MRVDVGSAHHGMLDAEVDTRLVRVDADLDRIVNAPRMRQDRVGPEYVRVPLDGHQ